MTGCPLPDFYQIGKCPLPDNLCPLATLPWHPPYFLAMFLDFHQGYSLNESKKNQPWVISLSSKLKKFPKGRKETLV